MDRKHFRGILRKYLQGRATAEQERTIDSWYEDMGKDAHSFLSREEESELEKRYWSVIGGHIARKQDYLSLANVPWYSYGIAASVCLFLLAYFYHPDKETLNNNNLTAETHASSATWKLVSNNGEIPLPVILPDRSTVILEPKSELKFLTSFDGSERSVYLAGEGFFEVTPDAAKPFLVFANKVTTKVLGTSFRVRDFQQDKNAIVAVKTGKVSVYTSVEITKDEARPDEIILTPNQQIVFDKAKNKISRMIVENPQLLLPAEEVKKMRFEASPVTEIFAAIEKVYGVDLVFDTDKLSSCILTSVISDGDLYNRLDIICRAIGATYSINENQIEIKGAGCNAP